MKLNMPSITYVLPDKMGGIFNIISSFLTHCKIKGMAQYAITVRGRYDNDATSIEKLPVDNQLVIEHRLPFENLHAVLRRLSNVIPKGSGILVANDWLELAMICRYNLRKTVIQIVHGDYEYYYDLAIKHSSVIDVFLTSSRTISEKLTTYLPHRRESIFYLPLGVTIPSKKTTPNEGPLRLIYIGRMDREKGIFDLPHIDNNLQTRRINVTWTIVGDGPDEKELFNRWGDKPYVSRLGIQPRSKIFDCLSAHDILVFPSRAEGFPISVLEAMAVGVVPIATDLNSGIPELVISGMTGYRLPLNDINGFAQAIIELDRNRKLLFKMSQSARQLVADKFDISKNIEQYRSLLGAWRKLYKEKPNVAKLHYGSRLDQPWLPNWVVITIRSIIRLLKRRRTI